MDGRDRWLRLCERALNLLSEREGFENDRPWIQVDPECNEWHMCYWHAAVWHRGTWGPQTMFGYRSVMRDDSLQALAARIVGHVEGTCGTDSEIDVKDLPAYEELDLRLSSYGF